MVLRPSRPRFRGSPSTGTGPPNRTRGTLPVDETLSQTAADGPLMVAQFDIRPRALNGYLRPGNAAAVPITWPAGSLAGRTFTSTLNALAVTVSINGDVMTITVPETQTDDLPIERAVEWLLTETTGGISDVILKGRWTASNDAAPTLTQGSTIVIDANGSISLDISGEASLTAHKNRLHKANTRVPAGWGENAWFLGRDLADTQIVGVDFWSDSIGTDGVGVSPASSQRTLGVAGLLETGLQAELGDGGSGYLPGSTAYATQTGTWTAEVGFGGVGFRATAAATMEWTGLRGKKIRFFHRNQNITGQFRYSIDGGAFTTVTTPAGFGLDPNSIDITGLSESGTHTFRVEWVSGTVVAHGVYAEKTTGVNIRRFGASGRAAAHYSYSSLGRFKANTTNGQPTVTCDGPAGWFNSSLIGKYLQGSGIPVSAKVTAVASTTSLTIDKNATATATGVDVDVCLQDTVGIGVPGATTNFEPFLNSSGCGRPHLLIVMLGANDPANADVTARQFRDGYSRILKPYYSSSASALAPSLIVDQEHQGNWFDIYGRWPEMTSVMDSIAAGMGGVYLDHWGIGHRQHQYMEDQGWAADAIHPSTLGHRELYYEPLFDVCMMTP